MPHHLTFNRFDTSSDQRSTMLDEQPQQTAKYIYTEYYLPACAPPSNFESSLPSFFFVLTMKEDEQLNIRESRRTMNQKIHGMNLDGRSRRPSDRKDLINNEK
jgi:hypothetical protein